MSIKIYFDLDGTVADFYSQENWLEMLRTETSGAFANCKPLFEKDSFYTLIMKLLAKGVQFGVITWLPMQASTEYEEICTKEKLSWCETYLPFLSEFSAQSYGIPKQNAIRKHATTEILIDDNSEICTVWQTEKRRKAYQVDESWDICAALEEIYDTYFGE